MFHNNENLEVFSGTTILLLVTVDTLWMAADTKASIIVSANSHRKSFSHNKIHQNNNIFYGVTGAYRVGKTSYYDAYEIMDAVIKKNTGIVNSYNACKDSLLKRLNFIIDSLVSKKSYSYINTFLNKPGIFEFVIAAFEKGKPNYYSVRYALKSIQNKFKVVIADTEYFKETNGEIIVRKGYVSSIIKFMDNNPYYLASKDRVKERLTCLIKIQADKTPEEVGLPVDVVAISKGKPKWFKGNKDCVIR